MKKEIFIGLVLLLVLNFSCQQKPERWTATSPEIEITKALVKDYETANWSAWILHYADTAKIHHNSVQRISPQQLKQSFEKSTANFSTYKFSEKDMFVEMIIDDKMNKWVYFWGTWEGKIIGSDKELKEIAEQWCHLVGEEPTIPILNAFCMGAKIAISNKGWVVNQNKKDD